MATRRQQGRKRIALEKPWQHRLKRAGFWGKEEKVFRGKEQGKERVGEANKETISCCSIPTALKETRVQVYAVRNVNPKEIRPHNQFLL